MSTKDGFDSKKRWGNSAKRGHGVNSPAMMEARKGFSEAKDKKKDVAKKMSDGAKRNMRYNLKKHDKEYHQFNRTIKDREDDSNYGKSNPRGDSYKSANHHNL